jgi:hypothetical protein
MKKHFKLNGREFHSFMNGTFEIAFTLTSCETPMPFKDTLPGTSSGRPALPFQLSVRGFSVSAVFLQVVFGFETEEEMKTCEKALTSIYHRNLV